MKLSKIMLAGIFACGSASVFAADTGTLTFNGSVLAESCEITSSTDGNQTITLPPAKVSEFSGVGSSPTSTATDFNITLSGCPASSYVISFPSDLNAANVESSNIKNQAADSSATAATNVALALYNQGNATALDLSSTAYSESKTSTSETDTLTFPFTVNYISTDATVSAGNVTGKLEYQIAYE